MHTKSIDLMVACGNGSAALVRTDLATYREVFDHAQQAPNVDFLIASGQVQATGIRIERTELFDAAHWFATSELKPAGVVHVIEITREAVL